MNKKGKGKGKDIVDRIVHQLTLKLFKAGCDPLNYQMLKILSKETMTSELKKEMNLSLMSISRRTNKLFDAGLILKSRTGYICTGLGTSFLGIIEKIKTDVKKELPNLIK